jgi:hypothetical protein
VARSWSIAGPVCSPGANCSTKVLKTVFSLKSVCDCDPCLWQSLRFYQRDYPRCVLTMGQLQGH